MPSAEGLFARAISQSGFGREPGVPWEEATEEARVALSPLAGSDPSASELRALDAAQVMAVPTEHGPDRPDPLRRRSGPGLGRGRLRGRDRGRRSLPGRHDRPRGRARLRHLGHDRGPATPGRGWSTGPVDVAVEAYGGEQELGLYATSDVLFTEPARHLALAHAGDAPTYRYRFTIAPDTVLAADGGAPHTRRARVRLRRRTPPGHPRRERRGPRGPGGRPVGGLRHRR